MLDSKLKKRLAAGDLKGIPVTEPWFRRFKWHGKIYECHPCSCGCRVEMEMKALDGTRPMPHDVTAMFTEAGPRGMRAACLPPGPPRYNHLLFEVKRVIKVAETFVSELRKLEDHHVKCIRLFSDMDVLSQKYFRQSTESGLHEKIAIARIKDRALMEDVEELREQQDVGLHQRGTELGDKVYEMCKKRDDAHDRLKWLDGADGRRPFARLPLR